MIEISVIIPTYNSEYLLLRALKAIEDQNYPHSKFEVLVVDDGSKDNTKTSVDDFAKSSNLQLKYFWQINQGPGPARNVGIENSKGEIIAFTDADCIPDKDWLDVIKNEILINNKQLIGGLTYSNDILIFPWKIAPAGNTKITANLSFNKKALTNIRFDDNFLGLIGQDIDFVNRIENMGYKYEDIPDMKVLHPANTLGVKGVRNRVLARYNEVQSYKLYGRLVIDTFHPIFRPTILGRFSIATVSYIAALSSLLILVYLGYALEVFIIIILVFIAFITYFYKLFVTNNPKKIRITFTDRLTTFMMLIYYFPLYIYARVMGSIKFKFLMI